MSKSKLDFKCPECSGEVSVWADLDAEVTFKINSRGKLVKRKIENSYQTDGRCGVKCTNCNWAIDHMDSVSPDLLHFEYLANEALAYQHEIRLLSIRSKARST